MTTFETTVQVYCHRVQLSWWNICGDVTEDDLVREGEDRAKEMIADECCAGELNHEGDETSARGWWKIAQ